MRIWHDDIRPKPTGWDVWVRTNEEALTVLREHGESVLEISLDHDLGLHTITMPDQYHDLAPDQQHAIFLAGCGEETGLDLVIAMIAEDLVPPKVCIHSWNGVGARRMMTALQFAAPHRLKEIDVFPFNPEDPPCR